MPIRLRISGWHLPVVDWTEPRYVNSATSSTDWPQTNRLDVGPRAPRFWILVFCQDIYRPSCDAVVSKTSIGWYEGVSKEGNIICIIKICEMNIAQRETDCGGNTFHDPIDCMIARTQPYLTPEVEVKLADRVEPILTLDVEPLCSPLLDGVDTAGYQFLVVPSKGPVCPQSQRPPSGRRRRHAVVDWVRSAPQIEVVVQE